MPAPTHSDDEQAVLTANDGFYTAFQAMELDSMSAVWSHADDVCCIHPGWQPLVGWQSVRSSFVAIFAGEGWLRVVPDQVVILVEGDLAWVRCIEVVSSLSSFGSGQARVAATNLFRREAGGWMLLLHHGSPVASPQDVGEDEPEDLN
jgi:ketosteroid isomerase-like protein